MMIGLINKYALTESVYNELRLSVKEGNVEWIGARSLYPELQRRSQVVTKEIHLVRTVHRRRRSFRMGRKSLKSEVKWGFG